MPGEEPKDGLRVLSFDGPPFPQAALSELFFLQQLAHRWAFNEDDEIEGDDVRVSDMFDIMVGCGMGGLYAILFARLNMTIGQVMEFHMNLTRNLFTTASWTQMDNHECTKALDHALDLTVSHLGIPVGLDSPFQSKDGKKCFIVVLNKTGTHAPSPRLLRSYRVRVGSSPRCTIRQALHATLADLNSLPAVLIDDERFISASTAFPNPSCILLKDLAANFPKLHLACLVNVGADKTRPPNDSHTVGQDLMAQFRSLGCFFRLSVREELHAASEIKSLVFGYLQEDVISKMSGEIVDAIKERKGVVNLVRLSDLAGEDGTHELRADISQLRNEGDIKRALEKLRSSFDFPSLYEHGCLDGTRVDVLEHIEAWAWDVNAPNVFWLEGYPGTGKTFISISLKQRLAKVDLLGASCFFRREDASYHRLDALVRSIAFQLANKPGVLQNALIQTVNSDVVKFEGAPGDLFAHLIYEPLTAACADFNKSIVIVLDALDEFGQSDADQLHLLNHLLPRWTQLPSRCKLFIASRSQGILPRHLDLPVHRIQRLAIGDDASAETISDIRIFLKHGLETIQDNFHSPTALVTDAELETLVKASSGLFVWASTVIQMVKQKSLRRAAKLLLRNLCTEYAAIEPPRLQPLHKLYRTAQVVELSPDVLAKSTFFSALARVRSPLSPRALASLSKVDVDDIQDIVLQLAPVMDTTRGLRFVHKSFLDYVTSHDFPLLLDFDAIELAFADSCLKIMHAQLHFNMGCMPSSHMLNSEMPKLYEALSEELRYASRFWGSHLTLVQRLNKWGEVMLAKALDDILNRQFFFWLEAVSILGCFREAIEVLSALMTAGFGKEVASFAHDALTFVRQFTTPISHSYPHIYVSAIPWMPKTSLVRDKYLYTVPHTLKILSGGDRIWPAQSAVIQSLTDSIFSVTFSPDGSQIVSGCGDNTIRIWDAATHQPIGEPLRGHKGSVYSVAFSPDGSQIVSGSDDNTIRIWDAAARQQIGEPVLGHTSQVRSVVFSPDGSQVVSGSDDNTIRIWDAYTRQPIGEPLLGHDGSVYSVAFSSDGSQIVSGSDDNTVQIWDTATSQPIGGPLLGHCGSVRPVAFSPDGSQIASGSSDGTIQIWDTATRQPIGEPLLGHSNSVRSLAFSPDGSQIASVSSDGTIQIWDTAARQPIGEPLRGHNGSVYSVAFSPDGSQIVSGSDDNTIRIWDAHTRQPIEKPPLGPSGSVLSVAFSPDGSQIASGSSDGTIQIWDTATRQPIGEPLLGHNYSVRAVAFSSDGSQVVSGSADNAIRIWDVASRQPIGEPLRCHKGTVHSVAFSPDGSQVVSGSADNTIQIWDAVTRQPIGEPLLGGSGSVISVAFSPDGSRIVSRSSDRRIYIWDAATRRQVGVASLNHHGHVNSVKFSPDGPHIVSRSENRVIHWAATRRPIREHLIRCGSDEAVAFSPDGSQIAWGLDDRSIRLSEVVTRQPIGGPLLGHERPVLSIAFSPDGSQIVSGSKDKTIRIWDAASCQSIGEPIHASKPLSFARVSHPCALPCFLLHSGWVVDEHNHRLVWVPQHLREFLPTPGLIDIIGTRRMIILDASDMRTGTDWASCVDTSSSEL